MILLDNIIFSLQSSGGISIVWYEHIKHLLLDKRLKNLCFIDYDISNNIFRKHLDIPKNKLVNTSPKFLCFKRYLDVKCKNKYPFIFHSSYYRICKNKHAINITTVHDFTYEYFASGLIKKIHCWQKHRAIRHSDYIICISKNTKKDLLKLLPDVDPQKIYIVYNGVSDEYFIIKDKKCGNYDLPYKNNSFVLFVGARTGYKNFELVVKAITNSSLNLVIVGGELTKHESFFLENNLGKERYKYVGRVSNHELNLLYNNAFCLLYPSAYEGFGIPVLEAQKAGCPVIAYNSSSIPEIIGENSLLLKTLSVSEINRCINLLYKKDFRESIIKHGIDNAKRFTWDRTYEQIYAIYQEALNSIE